MIAIKSSLMERPWYRNARFLIKESVFASVCWALQNVPFIGKSGERDCHRVDNLCAVFARQTSQTVENDRETLRGECHEIISGRGAFSDKLHVNSSTYARLGSTLTISGERNDRDGFNSIQKGKEKYEDTHNIQSVPGDGRSAEPPKNTLWRVSHVPRSFPEERR